MKKLVSGMMMATLVGTCANAAITVEQRRAACEKSADKVWVPRAQTCVPKDVCADNNLAKTYCLNLYLTSYDIVPYGASIRPTEVINAYAKETGLDCSVAESEVFISNDRKNVPCQGDDYMLFSFGNADYVNGNVTDVLCRIGGNDVTTKINHGGAATICSGMNEQSCNRLKDLVGNKVHVEFQKRENSGEDACIIGERAPDAVNGYIWKDSISVK